MPPAPHSRTQLFTIFSRHFPFFITVQSQQPELPGLPPFSESPFHFHAASCAVVSGFMPASVYLCIVFAISNGCAGRGHPGKAYKLEKIPNPIPRISLCPACPAFVSKFRLKLFLSCKSLRLCNFLALLPGLYQIFHLWLKI